MSELLRWWVLLQMAGLAGLPAASLLLRGLPDRGYALLKPLGLLCWAYLLWIGASLHVYPNSRPTIIVTWLVLASGGVLLLRVHWGLVRGFVRSHWRYMLAAELVFAAAFVFFALLRAYEPSLTGTEKPMDLALLTGVLRSDHFPPQDPWLAGYGVSYYYGGYVQNGMLVSLAGIPPWVGYNVAVAGVGAMAAAAAFGLAWNIAVLVRGRRSAVAGYRLALVCGLSAVVLLLLLGSGEGVLELVAAHGGGPGRFWEWWDIERLGPGRTDAWYPTEFFWWWRATRTTPDTITEFPFFSFLLGDLHPHLMAIPLGIAAVGIALDRLLRRAEPSVRLRGAQLGALALFLGGLAWTNTWDLPTLGFVICVAWGLARAREGVLRPRSFAVEVAAVVVLAVVLYLPFYASFRSQASGLLPDRSAGTRPAIAFLLWAPLLTLSAAMFLRRPVRPSLEHVALPLGLFGLWSVALFTWEGPAELRLLMADRGGAWLTVASYSALLTVFLASLGWWRRRAEPAGPAWTLVLLCGLTGALLLLGAELFYIRDVFDNRMNTVFKLSYQAWLLLSIAGVGGVVALAGAVSARGSRRAAAAVLGGLAVVLVAAGLAYTVSAVMNRTGGLAGERTLDGLAFLQEGDPGEYELVRWLWEQPPETRIVEATGRDYSDSGRVSARTGLQTVVGWVGHQQQWRGSMAPFEGRYEDVEELYATVDAGRAVEIARRYGVDYVVVGSLERQRYPPEGLRKFEERFARVFESGGVVVYGVPPEDEPLAGRELSRARAVLLNEVTR